MYIPNLLPEKADTAALQREFQAVANALNGPVEYVVHKVLYAAPKKLFDGLEVLADGTLWNPGSGAGKYYYLNNAWHFLG